MIKIELNNDFDSSFRLEFRYVLQHKDSGDFLFELFSIEELQSGLLPIILYSDEYKDYNLLGYDVWTGLYDRKSKKIYVNDILKHRNVHKYSNIAPKDQEFLVTYGISKTNQNQVVSSGFMFKPLNIDSKVYTMFNTKIDTDIISNTWINDIKYKKDNYSIKI